MQTKKTHDAADLVELATVIAVAVLDGRYRPTLQDGAKAAAFDAAMKLLNRDQRAWRGGSWVEAK